MTRRCGDAVTPANLPKGLPLYGAYDDGSFDNITAVRVAEPQATVFSITVTAADDFGDCLDVEKYDATPAQAPGWVVKRRAAGHGGPLVYCSWSALPAVKAAFDAAKVAYPGFWVAGYPAPDGDAIPPGCVGHQWVDHGGWDESIFVDYLPGIDPAPYTPTKEDEMNASFAPNGDDYIIAAANSEGHLLVFQRKLSDGTHNSYIDVTAQIGGATPPTVAP